MSLPAVQEFRAEIQAKGFRRMTDDEVAVTRRNAMNGHHNNRIEGIHPDAETWGLFQVLLDERVPGEEWSGLVMGFTLRQYATKRQ